MKNIFLLALLLLVSTKQYAQVALSSTTQTSDVASINNPVLQTNGYAMSFKNCPDMNSSLSVTAERGTRCGEPQSIEVTITNNSSVSVAIECCIAKKDGSFNTSYNGTVAPGASAVFFECAPAGSGQYYFGSIKSSDWLSGCKWADKCGK